MPPEAAVEDEVIETLAIEDDEPTTPEDRGDDFSPETSEDEPAAEVAEPEVVEEEAAKPGSMIPKSRFDEVNNAKKAAELNNAALLAEIEALRKGEVKPEAAPAKEAVAEAAPEVATLEDQYTDALMDGDRDKARELRMQINAIIRDSAVQEIEHRTSQATESNNIAAAASAVIAQYPEFNDAGENANAEAIGELVEMRDFFISAKGMSPAEAITKAAEKVARMYNLGAKAETEEEADETKPVDDRTVVAIKRGAKVAASQPSTAAVGVGTRQDAAKVNIQTMSEEQFEALPEAEKRRMRGD
ncbi:MAG: hypothetical protein AB7E55_23125 [Pigmentiphaga sp.]